MAEINVVPFIDVMLVLLVIFMITAPLLFNGIELKLPKTQKVNRVNLTEDQVVISATRAGEYYINEEKYLFKELKGKLKGLLGERGGPIFLRADDGLQYGKVANLLSHLKRSGFSNIALVTEADDSAP